MRQTIAIVFGVLVLTSCGGSSSSTPSSPTTPTPARFRLSGTVSSTQGAAVSGAVVLVLDGPNASRQATTDPGGRYAFEALEQSGFTIRVTAPNFEGVSLPVNLTADTVRDVTLTRILRADLKFGGDLEFTLQPGGKSWAMRGTGRNAGDSCAGNVTGASTFVNPNGGTIATLNWSLPSATVIRPEATFTYDMCCLDVSAASAGGTYSTAATYSTVACP